MSSSVDPAKIFGGKAGDGENKPLARHRILSPTAAVRVSPLCLGTMSFGGKMAMTGSCDEETSHKILDAFVAAGGNFIDTANAYGNGDSERIIGRWFAAHPKMRDQIVLATKYTSPWTAAPGSADNKDRQIHTNFIGNSSKSLIHSFEASLEKMQTSYIDILYVHWWDWTTSIPELMQSLNHLVRQGKVLYLGASDLPAYVVAKANEYARHHGLTGFSLYQGRWSAIQRDFERDILHMARDDGLALVPWGVLASGMFKTKADREALIAKGEPVREPLPGTDTEVAARVAELLQKVADKNNERNKGSGAKATISAVAIAYLMHKAPNVFPLVGMRKVEHLAGVIDALTVEISEEEMKEIESFVPFDVGFPLNMFGSRPEENFMMSMAGTVDFNPRPSPVKPHKSG